VWLRWEHQREMVKPQALAFPVLAAGGGLGPAAPITPADAHRVYHWLVAAADTLAEADASEEVRDWIDSIASAAFEVGEVNLNDPAAVFLTLDEAQCAPAHGEDSQRVLMLVDGATGERYFRTADVKGAPSAPWGAGQLGGARRPGWRRRAGSGASSRSGSRTCLAPRRARHGS